MTTVWFRHGKQLMTFGKRVQESEGNKGLALYKQVSMEVGSQAPTSECV